MHGEDVAAIVGLAQRFPHHEYGLCEVRLLNDAARPDPFHQFVFGHNPFGVLYQQEQDIEGLRVLSQITVGFGNEDQCHPYEVWGITPSQTVFRFDYCSNQFNESPGSLLTQIATGGADVWGIIDTQIYHYSFGQEKFVQVPGTLTQITVGVNDVWGVDRSNNDNDVYRYDPAGGVFNLVGGSTAQVAAGGDGVWLIDTSDNVWRFDSSSESFLQVSGVLKSIAAGSGAGVFGVNNSHQVFTFVRP